MKINGNEIRPGMIILYENKLARVTASQHVKPGKGGAYAQTEIKELLSGTKHNVRFRSDEGVERAILEQKDFAFSYKDGDMFVFLDLESYEEITLSSREIPVNQQQYIQDGIKVKIELYEDKPLGITLPSSVILKIVQTEPTLKNQTVSNSFKPAILSNGIRVMVPAHLAEGVDIVINTETNDYVERAK